LRFGDLVTPRVPRGSKGNYSLAHNILHESVHHLKLSLGEINFGTVKRHDMPPRSAHEIVTGVAGSGGSRAESLASQLQI